MLKAAVRSLLESVGIGIYRLPDRRSTSQDIPDKQFYAPLFSPWKGYGDFPAYYSVARPYTLVSPDRCHILLAVARQASSLPGAWIECGVFRGGTAMLLAKLLNELGRNAPLHLFDTFAGMPETDARVDLHEKGDFSDTSVEGVRAGIRAVAGPAAERVVFHPGVMPETFQGCAIDRVALAHVDVDIYRSVLDCCEFIYPRLVDGGILLFDDYGFPACPGARRAVDEFFVDRRENPIVLPTGQALVVKCPTGAPARNVQPVSSAAV